MDRGRIILHPHAYNVMYWYYATSDMAVTHLEMIAPDCLTLLIISDSTSALSYQRLQIISQTYIEENVDFST